MRKDKSNNDALNLSSLQSAAAWMTSDPLVSTQYYHLDKNNTGKRLTIRKEYPIHRLFHVCGHGGMDWS